MISNATTVDEYLSELDDERRGALTFLRDLIRDVAPDANELMKYGHPHWELDGSLFAIASQKHHLALYVAEKGVMREFAPGLKALKGVDAAVGCVRFRKLDRLPPDTVRNLLEAAARRRRERSDPVADVKSATSNA